MLAEKRGWRRSPISPLAYAIRMEGVRQANIFPSCRLDKTNRSLYEPEDVRAKRSSLVKPDTRSSCGSSRARGKFKQKVLALSTTGVTKENMDAVDRVKETVAVLMKNKERAADIGTAERCILQPQIARRMARMSAEKRADFERRVQQAVEKIVYAAKRRFVRRQVQLDEAGIFHPEANAHRVHTLFWADLNKKVDLTTIENAEWAKMCAEVNDTIPAPGAPKSAAVPHRSTGGRTANESDSGRLSSKDGSRQDVESSKAAITGDDPQDGIPSRSATVGSNRKSGLAGKVTHNVPGKDGERAAGAGRVSSRPEPRAGRAGPDEREKAEEDAAKGFWGNTLGETMLPASPGETFAEIPGYDEVGHVPTLDEFRAGWPRTKTRADSQESRPGSGSKWGRRKQPQQAQGQALQGAGSVVNELSKRDEVFRHFKRYYEKADHKSGRVGDELFPAGSNTTGLLQPDFEVIEAVGKHTAQARESRGHSRIGEGLLSTTGETRRSGGNRPRQRADIGARSTSVGQDSGNGDGLTNFFRESMYGSDGAARKEAQGAVNSFPARGNRESKLPLEGSRDGAGASGDGRELSGSLGGGVRTLRSAVRGRPPLSVAKGSTESQRAKGLLEGGSTSAELQARLEASWRALLVPARLRLDFLQKYSTLERALDLPVIALLLEIASKTVPLREKVVDLLHRVEGDGEPMSAASVFCTFDEERLCDLGCWIDFSTVARSVLEQDPNDDTADATVEPRTAGGYEVDKAPADGGVNENEGRGEGNADEAEGRRVSFPQDAVRRQEAEAVSEWLRSIESRLVEKCAEVCDTAWYDLGETITYQGRPVAHSLPAVAMDTAMQRREDKEDREKLGRRAR